MPSKFPGEKEEEATEEEETLVEELLVLLEVLLLLVMATSVEVDGGARWHSKEDLLQWPCRHCTKGSPLPWWMTTSSLPATQDQKRKKMEILLPYNAFGQSHI